MLVLSFQRCSFVFCGGPTFICCVEIKASRVRMGLSAEAEVPIVRDDVLTSMLQDELGVQRAPGEEDLLPEERAALQAALDAINNPECEANDLFAALNTEPIMELLLGFQQSGTNPSGTMPIIPLLT